MGKNTLVLQFAETSLHSLKSSDRSAILRKSLLKRGLSSGKALRTAEFITLRPTGALL